MNSLKDVWIGAVRDYDYGEVMNRYIASRKGKSVELTTGENAKMLNIRKLGNGRIKTIIEDPVVMAYTSKRLGLNPAFINASARFGRHLYCVCAKDEKLSQIRRAA
jgi:hypothetical protein